MILLWVPNGPMKLIFYITPRSIQHPYHASESTECKAAARWMVSSGVVRSPAALWHKCQFCIWKSILYQIKQSDWLFLTVCLLLAQVSALHLDICRPRFSTTSPYIVNTIGDNEHLLWICTGLKAVSSIILFSFSPSSLTRCLTAFQFAAMSNLHTQLTLRSLGPEGTRKHAIPHGYGFNQLLAQTTSLKSWDG